MKKGRGLAQLVTIALLGACNAEPRCEPAALDPLPATPAFAIVTSDYTTSAIALLDGERSLLTEAWIDSGTAHAGLGAALSGDVVLPSAPFRSGELTFLDRLGVDVVTRIAIPSGGVLAQTHVQRDDGAGYRANPRDVLLLGGDRALVTRFEPNDAWREVIDSGDDAIVLDLASGEIVERVDLEGALDDETRAYARPDRLARIRADDGSEHVVIGLARLDRSFMRAAGGMVAWVPVASDGTLGTPHLFELDRMSQCGHVIAAADRSSAMVVCAGETFSDEAGRRARAGVARVRVQDGALILGEGLRAATLPDAPVPTHGAIALPDGRVFAIASGDTSTPDRAVIVDIALGTITEIHRASAAFTLGEGTLDGDRVLLPDASRGILVLDPLNGAVDVVIDPSPCRELPAREIRRL